MPKPPKINHPVRQVRMCLGHTQASFAKLVGCSAIAIQRIENGSLKLSLKLAHAIAEATCADPKSLLSGPGSTALDALG
ncbi:MAG: helix-turn-helix transcriptional regulator, partial [Limisphaerales bacterium]